MCFIWTNVFFLSKLKTLRFTQMKWNVLYCFYCHPTAGYSFTLWAGVLHVYVAASDVCCSSWGHIMSLWGSPEGTCQHISVCGIDTGPSRTEGGTGSGAGLCPCRRWRRCSPQPRCNGSASACSCTRGSVSNGAGRWKRPGTRAPVRACGPFGS